MNNKTYEYEGTKLVKEVANKDNPCKGCFFSKKDYEFCGGFFPFCDKGVDGNKEHVIFVEPVKKID